MTLTRCCSRHSISDSIIVAFICLSTDLAAMRAHSCGTATSAAAVGNLHQPLPHHVLAPRQASRQETAGRYYIHFCGAFKQQNQQQQAVTQPYAADQQAPAQPRSDANSSSHSSTSSRRHVLLASTALLSALSSQSLLLPQQAQAYLVDETAAQSVFALAARSVVSINDYNNTGGAELLEGIGTGFVWDQYGHGECRTNRQICCR
jgi:hypothetical protein